MTESEIFPTVQSCIADSLALQQQEIEMESRLFADLGADSLDFLELIFMLERRFDIELRDTEFDFLSQLDFSSPEVMSEGFLTPATVESLRQWLPALDEVADATRVSPSDLLDAVRVSTICAMLEKRLGE